jgi:hypothetical protein
MLVHRLFFYKKYAAFKRQKPESGEGCFVPAVVENIEIL